MPRLHSEARARAPARLPTLLRQQPGRTPPQRSNPLVLVLFKAADTDRTFPDHAVTVRRASSAPGTRLLLTERGVLAPSWCQHPHRYRGTMSRSQARRYVMSSAADKAVREDWPVGSVKDGIELERGLVTYTIDYFMWGYQGYFRIGLESTAEQLFAKLDRRLAPSVFLVGILTNSKRTDRHVTCVEPERNFWIHSEEFHGIGEVAMRLAKEYPEAQMHHSHPLEHERQERRLTRLGLRDAIQMTVESHPRLPEGRRVICLLSDSGR